ncbi:MAG: AbrB/MazE/SpoVT family DNA-binding domain-containing protein [Bacilli bacterium]
MVITLKKIGNSRGIIIPSSILKALDIKDNDELTIVSSNKNIIIKKNKQTAKTLADLFANYHGDYEPVEVDWGKPKGREVW